MDAPHFGYFIVGLVVVDDYNKSVCFFLLNIVRVSLVIIFGLIIVEIRA